MPEIERGAAVSGSLVQGPGKGRAKRLQESCGEVARELPAARRTAAEAAEIAAFEATLRAETHGDPEGDEAMSVAAFQDILKRATEGNGNGEW